MEGTIVRPPRTIMEVFKMLPEGTLAEIIDNTLYMSPAPTPFHQEISANLLTDINLFVRTHKLGKMYASQIDVYLDETSNAVQPDLLFVSKSNEIRIDQYGIHGSPDLIIEILSPGNKKYDLVIKKDMYEKKGVKEYWTIDPESKIASGYFLEKGTYRALGEFNAKMQSRLFGKDFSF